MTPDDIIDVLSDDGMMSHIGPAHPETRTEFLVAVLFLVIFFALVLPALNS